MPSLPKWRLLLVKKTSAGPNHEKYTDLLLNTYYYNSATLYLNTYHFYFNFFFWLPYYVILTPLFMTYFFTSLTFTTILITIYVYAIHTFLFTTSF